MKVFLFAWLCSFVEDCHLLDLSIVIEGLIYHASLSLVPAKIKLMETVKDESNMVLLLSHYYCIRYISLPFMFMHEILRRRVKKTNKGLARPDTYGRTCQTVLSDSL